jgi:hypothetical protein
MKSPDPAKSGGTSGSRQQPEERVMQAGKEAAGGLAREAEQEARSAVERGKAEAAGAADRTSAALDETAANLAAQGQETLAEVAGMLSSKLSGLARALESRSLDDLAREARTLARDNPGMFIAGGVALGMALSRFFKASAVHKDSYGQPGSSGAYSSGYSSGYSSDESMYRSGASGTSTYGSTPADVPYGTEAAVPPGARNSTQQSTGSSSTPGGAAGSAGTHKPMGGSHD